MSGKSGRSNSLEDFSDNTPINASNFDDPIELSRSGLYELLRAADVRDLLEYDSNLHACDEVLSQYMDSSSSSFYTNESRHSILPTPASMSISADTYHEYCQPVITTSSTDSNGEPHDTGTETKTNDNDMSGGDNDQGDKIEIRKCHVTGCLKFPQSSTQYCISHGGGRRCTYPDCTKAARDRLLCAAHGGGRRCSIDNCLKSAVGGSCNCSLHGGGKKCQSEGCQKAAQSPTNFCVTHGGGKRCTFEHCNKVARGKTLFCSGHGGGVRCGQTGCNRAAIAKSRFCRFHNIIPVSLKPQTAGTIATTSVTSTITTGDHASPTKIVPPVISEQKAPPELETYAVESSVS